MKRNALALALLVSLSTLVWAQAPPTPGLGSGWRGFLILWGIIIAAALLFVLLMRLFKALRLFLKR